MLKEGSWENVYIKEGTKIITILQNMGQTDGLQKSQLSKLPEASQGSCPFCIKNVLPIIRHVLNFLW